jgi:hypothetical protein
MTLLIGIVVLIIILKIKGISLTIFIVEIIKKLSKKRDLDRPDNTQKDNVQV